MSDNIALIIQFIAIVITVISLLLTMVGAFKAGVLKKVKFGKIEIESSDKFIDEGKEVINEIKRISTNDALYEVEQLAKYYSQILSQFRVSFWFSLIFASLGFIIIIASVILYTNEKIGTTIASFVAGTIVDAISALFFVQSNNAQKSMGEFFDKLRSDHQQLESRKLCDAIENKSAKDAIHIQLALHFAEVKDSKEIGQSIIKECIAKTNEKISL